MTEESDVKFCDSLWKQSSTYGSSTLKADMDTRNIYGLWNYFTS